MKLSRVAAALLGLVLSVATIGAGDVVSAVTVGGAAAPDGTEVMADLPASQLVKNVGGRDGAGLCVFTSIQFAACWQNERRLEDFQKKMRQENGGGYPSKVDQMIEKYGKGTQFIQYEGNDPAIIKLALATGRMASVTWDGTGDPHYHGSRIAHMVSCVHYDERWVALRDNNFVGEAEIIWMTPAEFQRGWTGGRQGWAVILLSPPPPPIPQN